MAQEIELKFPVLDHAETVARLAALGADDRGTIEQADRYLDFPGRTLLAADSGLRVRCVAGRDDVLTFKGPRQDHATAKIREELEAACTPAGCIDAILEALGFVELITVCKRRETYVLDGCEVLLDTVDGLGFFVEVEGPTMETAQAVCEKLNLTGRAIRESYAQLLARTRGD